MTSFSRSINAILAALLAASVAGVAIAQPPLIDRDGDGVPDDNDECPYSAAGTKVDAEGCSTSTDADSDGVLDKIDLCPYSTIGIWVDAQGCALDEDFDGVANGRDQCPNSAYGERVDASGCEIVTPGSTKKAVSNKDEPVPVTGLAPPTGLAKVIVKTNPNYVDENELYAAPPPRSEARVAQPVVVPVPVPLAPSVPPAPVAAAAAKSAEAVIIQVAPSRAAEPAASVPAAAVAASTPKPAPTPAVAIPLVSTPGAASIPAPAVTAAPAIREKPVAEPVVLTSEQARANAEQRATMSSAATDRTPSLPKAATGTLPVPSLPADQFPPGYRPNRVSPQVNVPTSAVPGPVASTTRKPPVTAIPAASGAAVQAPTAMPAPVVAVTPAAPRAPFKPEPVPAIPVPSARAGGPVIAFAPAADGAPRAAVIAPPPVQDDGAETLAEISFAAGSAQVSPEATQRVRQLSSTVSSRLSDSPALELRLSGRRHAGESVEIEASRGLALRKAFIDEGIEDVRIHIVVIDGPDAAVGDYRVAVQLFAGQ